MNVYLFNPDSDRALAHEAEQRRKGLPRAVYTAKPFARRMAMALQLLPCWIASPGDAVLVEGSDEQVAQWQQWVDEKMAGITIVNRPPTGGDVAYRPWGWCNSVAHRLLARGAAPAGMPLDDEMLLDADIVAAASRLTTVKLHRLIADRLGRELCPPPVAISDDETLRERLTAAASSGLYLKKLYSGSGQGIFRQPPATTDAMPEMWRWLRDEFKRQEAVMLEPLYDRLMDMAVEFRCDGDGTEVDGYSVFEVDSHSQWVGTRIDSRQALHGLITAAYPGFDDVVEAVRQALNEVVPKRYAGFLGVDMLLYRKSDGGVGLNPCVELNLRTTMGVVAAHMGERHGRRGVLSMRNAALAVQN